VGFGSGAPNGTPDPRHVSATATRQGQYAGLAVRIVGNLNRSFADPVLIEDVSPRGNTGFQEGELRIAQFQIVSGRPLDVPGVDDQVEAVETQQRVGQGGRSEEGVVGG